ncbi:MAG TPA: hypothetical protein VFI13_07385, partial [Gemmatimonadales bacterium]|nr:hypothetical protein [Gemmatimonadales bacterium]
DTGAGWDWPAGQAEARAVAEPAPYRSKLGVDFGIATTAYTPGRYTSPGAALLLSDMLGDHVGYVSGTTYVGRDVGGVLDNLNFTAIYFDQSRRVNWGVGAFRAKGYVYEVNRVVDYKETSSGVFGIARYPLSTFRRLEGVFTLEHSDRFDFTLPVVDPHRVGVIATQSLSYVFDNTVWGETGPIDGTRYGVTGSLSNDLSNGAFDGWFVSADYRTNLRATRQSAYSVRGLGYYAGGERPRRINIGGSLGLRGFPWYGYVSGSKVWMVNQEFRFQLLDHFVLGFPFGDLGMPGVQAAPFCDLGAATAPGAPRAAPLLESRGVSWRMAFGPFAVLRFDLGKRWVHGDPGVYGLEQRYRSSRFASLFLGYNY